MHGCDAAHVGCEQEWSAAPSGTRLRCSLLAKMPANGIKDMHAAFIDMPEASHCSQQVYSKALEQWNDRGRGQNLAKLNPAGQEHVDLLMMHAIK